MEKKNKYFIQDGMISKFDFMDNQEFLPLETVCNLLNDFEYRFSNIQEIRYKTPQIERFAVVQYIHWDKKPYKIVKCFDAYKDANMKIRYCYYGCGSTNFKLIKICNTEEEAKKELERLRNG